MFFLPVPFNAISLSHPSSKKTSGKHRKKMVLSIYILHDIPMLNEHDIP
jgi:hypothetical protein